MILVFLGPPGAGKGTQARLIAKEFGLTHLSTGDMLRHAVKTGRPAALAEKIGDVMASGKLVPDEIMVEMIEQRITQPDCAQGVILDGFPRTVSQARSLDQMLAKNNLNLLKAFFFDVDEDLLIERIAGRYVCQSCGEGYHRTYKPTQKKRCL